jgi:hypothetical protein
MQSNPKNEDRKQEHDATKKAYSAIDVASFDPLITDVVLVEELAFALSPIVLPEPFDRIFNTVFGTAKTGKYVGFSLDYCNYLDRSEPTRVYRNALKQIFANRTYRRRNPNNRKPLIVESYGLVDWDVSAKKDGADRGDLLELSLQDIGKRIADLMIPYVDANGREINAFNLEFQYGEWLAMLKPIVKKMLASGDFERRLNRISVVTPLGLMHRYRQHFFYADLQKGRCELIRALAPYETLEVVTTQEKITTTEETVIHETEVTTSSSREQKDSTELTDRVASTVARTSTTNIATSGGYTAVLWNAGGSLSSNTTDSSNKTSERIAKTLNEITLKQSEQIRKKTTITTRVAETRSDSITTRHTFQNPSDKPVTYGLYKLGYEVKSVIQDMGPLLVWQTRIEKPGQSLATSVLLDKQVIPAEVENLPKKVRVTLYGKWVAQKFTLDANEVLKIAFDKAMESANELHGYPEYQKAIDGFYSSSAEKFAFKTTGISLVADHSGSKDHPEFIDHSSSVDWENIKLTDSRLTTEIEIIKSIPIWNNCYLYANVEFQVPQLKTKGYLPPDIGDPPPDEKSLGYRVKLMEIASILNATLTPRDRASLYFEERKTILANKIATIMQRAPISGSMSDEILMLYLKINDIFDVSQLFYDVDTFEFQEAANLATLLKTGRPNYPLISKAEGKAPTGSSLGWTHQVDGDTKRDMFLNAPFAWACLPVRPGKEKDAIEFLQDQNLLFGQSITTANLLRELEITRAAESLHPTSTTVITEKDADSFDKKFVSRPFIAETIKKLDKNPKKTIAEILEESPPSSSEVYPVIGGQATFVTIDGLAFQKIDMGTEILDLGSKSSYKLIPTLERTAVKFSSKTDAPKKSIRK